MDFASWIKRRLREAKSSGLIRIAKTTPPAKPAAKKAPASAKPGPSMGHAPRPIASSTPALAPARYDPNRYTRGADTPADASTAPAGGTVFKAAPAPAPARTPERRANPATTADPPTPADVDERGEFSPSVFQPPSSGGSAAARSHRGGRPIAVTWASSDESSDENVEGPGPAPEDVERSAAAAASAVARTRRDPAAPWFGRDGAMAPSGVYVDYRGSGPAGGGRRVLDPGHHPATVRGVGDKVRRMARASALARRDMSRRTDRDSLETPIGGSYSLLLDLQASEQERIAKERELSAARRRERALFAKNKELEETLSAQTSKAVEADEKIARAKREAQKAQAELVRAIERQRAEDRRVFERRSGRVDDRNVRGSSPVTGVERRFLAGVDEAPQTLKEAAARFLGDARKLHEAELRASLDLDGPSLHGTSRTSRESGGTSPAGPPSFLERMKERQRRAAARRAEKAFREQVERDALVGRGPGSGKPGWDDSPDVVVRIGGEPAPDRPRSAPGTARLPPRTPPKTKTHGGGRGAPPPRKMSVAAMRQRQADERRTRGLEPLADPKPRTPPPGQKRKKAPPQSAPQSARKLLEPAAPAPAPGAQPATGLFAMNPAMKLGNANPKDEIAAMRTILDEVVAHLRLLHVATGGRSGSAAASVRAAAEAISALPESSPDAPAAKYSKTLRSGGGRAPNSSAAKSPSDKGKKGKASGAASSSPGVPSRREVTAAMNAARLSGKLVLDSLDHSKALKMLRDVENNETALRAKWGLFSPDHPPPQGAEELALSYAERRARGIPTDAAVTASGDLVPLGQTDGEEAGDVGVESTRTAAVDADTVARVWEARNQYARWQAALDDGVADVSSPNGEGFSPCEVHEEIAERLLDAMLADVARELGDACDEATQIVLRHEFSSAANSIDASSAGGGGGDDDSDVLVVADGGTSTPPRDRLGVYDGATPAAMDVTLGAAMARVGLSPEEASAEIVEEEDLGVH